MTPKKLVLLGVFGLKEISRPTVLIGLSSFSVILYNAPILKFSRVIFCNFPNYDVINDVISGFAEVVIVMRFPPLYSS